MRRAALAAAVVVGLTWTAAARRASALGEATNGFPNWAERVVHEWMNRARCDPQVEMTACGSNCGDASCYSPAPPLPYEENLNLAARFHSDEMLQQNYFAHDSSCTVVSNIATVYPASCNAAASCACVGGTDTCSPTCTAWSDRVALFGETASGEIIASSTDPDAAFYQWLYEPFPSATCQFVFGPPTNGHRWNILMSTGNVGVGVDGPSVGDFGGSGTPAKLASGSHYPRQGSSVDVWTNWYDTAAPYSAYVNVDGVCTPLARKRGSDTNGAWTATITGMDTGCHRYFFVFNDPKGAVVAYPTTGTLGIGDASCADWSAGGQTSCPGVPIGDPGVDSGVGGAGGGSGTRGAGGGGGSANGGGGGAGGYGGPDGGENATATGSSSSGCGCQDAGGYGATRIGWAGLAALIIGFSRRRRVRGR